MFHPASDVINKILRNPFPGERASSTGKNKFSTGQYIL